jgi:hypothetical protein
MTSNTYLFMSLSSFIIESIGVLFQILVSAFLFVAGKQISKLHGSRRLMIGCYIIAALCIILGIFLMIKWILFFVNLGPNAKIEWH